MVASDSRGSLSAAAVHLVMVAQEDTEVRRAVLDATLVVPDGQPLVWALRALGHRTATRVYGPDLMERYCEHAAQIGTPVFSTAGATRPLWSSSRSTSARAFRGSSSSARTHRRFVSRPPRRMSRSRRASTTRARRSCGSGSASPARSNGWPGCDPAWLPRC